MNPNQIQIPNQQPTQVAIQIPMNEMFSMVLVAKTIVISQPEKPEKVDCCPRVDRSYDYTLTYLDKIVNREDIKILNITPSPDQMLQVSSMAFGGAEMAIHANIEALNSIAIETKCDDGNICVSANDGNLYPGYYSLRTIQWESMLPMSLPFVMTYVCKKCGATHIIIGKFQPTREWVLRMNEDIQKQVERAKNLSNIVLPGSNIVLPK